MRVFICEFLTGGGMRGEALPGSLAREGAMMRDALTLDLRDLGVEIVATHDDRLPPAHGADSLPVAERDDVWAVWAERAATADVAWAIAPETGGLLARLTTLLRESGALVIGPDDEAIRIASSKSLTAWRLAARGVATPPVWTARNLPPGLDGPFVLKPDDGAGCEATRLLEGRPEPDETPAGHVVQPFVPGDPASLTVLAAGGRARLLSANRQRVVVESDAFRFKGVAVAALEDRDGALAALAQAVVDAIPGLAGIFGIDLVLAAEGPVVIEVNPRLTTAYAGLRAAIGVNPAGLVAPFATAGAALAPRGRRTIEIAP